MKIIVDKIVGDATVFFYNKSGEIFYSEGFYGFSGDGYIRKIPEWVGPLTNSIKALYNKEFTYRIVE